MSGEGFLVFGSTGQVATELKRLAPKATFLDRQRANLADPSACVAAIRAIRPRAVINAAAWTAVDLAEAEEEATTLVNGTAPTAMASECAAMGVPFIQISTDYVFDGTGSTPFASDHPTAPLGAYGRSKLKGEEGVRSACGTHAILRTSWVFSPYGNNFLKTMLRLGREHKNLSVVGDQIGGPTPASAIAEACLIIASCLITNPEKTGTYHFSGSPDVSWADFAHEIMVQARLNCIIEDIPTTHYPTPAKRPANSRMDCTTLTVFNLSRPDWKSSVAITLHELGAIT